MSDFNFETFVVAFAIIGIVIIVSALLSGFIERSGLPQVAVFLAIGAALGPAGFGVANVTLTSRTLHVVATLSLTLVLFTDAVSLNISEVKRHSSLAFRMLGPGTLLSAVLGALAAWWLLGLTPAAALILGAALASTDPVLLRGLLRRRDIPASARQALQLESGLNDAVLLPVVIVAMAFLGQEQPATASHWAKLGFDLFILGPGAGVAVGLVAVAALDLIRRRVGVRRDYESLYSLGVAFTAFAAAEAVHGSGFLAAFTAGLTIAALDVELCDCFLEYGGVTAEMMLLFTFVLFGSSLIWSGFTVLSGATLLFAAITILIRPPVYLLSLFRSRVDRRGRMLIAWFGPSGLSSLLLVLLPVFAGTPGSEQLFTVCSLVVLVSVVVHGGSPLLLSRMAQKRNEEHPPTPAAVIARDFGNQPGLSVEPTSAAAVSSRLNSDIRDSDRTDVEPPKAREESSSQPNETIGSQSISLQQLKQLEESREPVIILDARTERSRETSDEQAARSVRLDPEHVVAAARELGLPKEAWLIAYCA